MSSFSSPKLRYVVESDTTMTQARGPGSLQRRCEADSGSVRCTPAGGAWRVAVRQRAHSGAWDLARGSWAGGWRWPRQWAARVRKEKNGWLGHYRGEMEKRHRASFDYRKIFQITTLLPNSKPI
jgi:hypothetical protein